MILRAPPTITFEIAPSVAVPGQSLTVTVRVCDDPVEHRALTLRLRCSESRRGALLPTSKTLAVHFDRKSSISESLLPAGDSAFEWTVTLRADLPPTFDDPTTIEELARTLANLAVAVSLSRSSSPPIHSSLRHPARARAWNARALAGQTGVGLVAP